MPLSELIYTPHDTLTSDERPHTFVLMVDPEMYAKQKKDKSIPLAEVVGSFQVLKYELPGRSGKMVKPSRREVEDVFGTTNEDNLVSFMLEKGKLHGKAEIKDEIYAKDSQLH